MKCETCGETYDPSDKYEAEVHERVNCGFPPCNGNRRCFSASYSMCGAHSD